MVDDIKIISLIRIKILLNKQGLIVHNVFTVEYIIFVPVILIPSITLALNQDYCFIVVNILLLYVILYIIENRFSSSIMFQNKELHSFYYRASCDIEKQIYVLHL